MVELLMNNVTYSEAGSPSMSSRGFIAQVYIVEKLR